MALKAGYYGLKRSLLNKVKALPGIKSIGSGLSLNSTTGELEATGATISIEANPEGAATENLIKLGLGDDIYAVPDAAKTYQTDDATESAIVDADYIPFLDSSAASGSGASKKSTWSNFISKIKAKITEFVTWEANSVLGAKNLLENTGTTQTKNGVTFTVNADKTVTVNGTATANTEFYLTSSKTGAQWKKILGSNVIMSGCAENGSASAYYIRIIRTNPSWQDFGSDYGEGVTLDISTMGDDSTYIFLIGISNGVTINNLVFKPMIRIAADTDDTYVSYAMTNRELTDVVKNIKFTSDGTSYIDLKQYVVKPTITFENGVGTATLYAPTGETIGTFAVACSNSGNTVAHVNVSGSTATVTLTDTSFSSTNPVTIIYFTYKA